MVHSDQLMLLREFQARYDAMWAKGAGVTGSKANVISILRNVAGQLEHYSKDSIKARRIVP